MPDIFNQKLIRDLIEKPFGLGLQQAFGSNILSRKAAQNISSGMAQLQTASASQGFNLIPNGSFEVLAPEARPGVGGSMSAREMFIAGLPLGWGPKEVARGEDPDKRLYPRTSSDTYSGTNSLIVSLKQPTIDFLIDETSTIFQSSMFPIEQDTSYSLAIRTKLSGTVPANLVLKLGIQFYGREFVGERGTVPPFAPKPIGSIVESEVTHSVADTWELSEFAITSITDAKYARVVLYFSNTTGAGTAATVEGATGPYDYSGSGGNAFSDVRIDGGGIQVYDITGFTGTINASSAATILNPDVTGATITATGTGASDKIVFTSDSVGASSSIQLFAGNHQAILGLPIGTVTGTSSGAANITTDNIYIIDNIKFIRTIDGSGGSPVKLSLFEDFIFIGNPANLAEGAPMSGDISIEHDSGGGTALTTVENVPATATIQLPESKFFVGDNTDVADPVDMAGDVGLQWITNTGHTTIQPDAVTYDKMQDVVDEGSGTSTGRVLGLRAGVSAPGTVEELDAADITAIIGASAMTALPATQHYVGNGSNVATAYPFTRIYAYATTNQTVSVGDKDVVAFEAENYDWWGEFESDPEGDFPFKFIPLGTGMYNISCSVRLKNINISGASSKLRLSLMRETEEEPVTYGQTEFKWSSVHVGTFTGTISLNLVVLLSGQEFSPNHYYIEFEVFGGTSGGVDIVGEETDESIIQEISFLQIARVA